MKVILDTNFILTCVKQKIDFFEELKFMGMIILVPKQVVREVTSLSTNRSKIGENARFALKLLKENRFEEVDLKNKNVDKGLIQFTEKNPDVLIATLDRELKKKIINSKIVIREKKRLEVI